MEITIYLKLFCRRKQPLKCFKFYSRFHMVHTASSILLIINVMALDFRVIIFQLEFFYFYMKKQIKIQLGNYTLY